MLVYAALHPVLYLGSHHVRHQRVPAEFPPEQLALLLAFALLMALGLVAVAAILHIAANVADPADQAASRPAAA